MSLKALCRVTMYYHTLTTPPNRVVFKSIYSQLAEYLVRGCKQIFFNFTANSNRQCVDVVVLEAWLGLDDNGPHCWCMSCVWLQRPTHPSAASAPSLQGGQTQPHTRKQTQFICQVSPWTVAILASPLFVLARLSLHRQWVNVCLPVMFAVASLCFF